MAPRWLALHDPAVLVPDLHAQGVENHHRINGVQRPRAPFLHLVQDRVGHAADQVGGDLEPVELLEMAPNVAHAHAARVHGDDLVIQAVDPGLALGDQARLEAALPVARHLDLEQAALTPHRLAANPVPAVRLNQRRLLPMLVAEMLGQLRAQHPLHQRLLEVLHQPAVAQQIFRPLAAPKQLVQNVVVDLLRHGPRCPFLSAWTGSPVHRRSDTLHHA
jgi:hypothetical protein